MYTKSFIEVIMNAHKVIYRGDNECTQSFTEVIMNAHKVIS